jgi:histone acetyltransferase 1
MTIYEAFQNAEKMRLKISQVLVLPPFQRNGIATQLYETVYDNYKENEPRCFEIIVEDAADDFQKI